MKKEDFYYDSDDKITKIHGIRWIPEGKIKGIIHIAHGMLEHVNRYDEFGRYFASKGFLVTGNDHLGHGYSVNSEEDRGYFSKIEGNKTILEDMHNLHIILKQEYKNIPYFILGHSMGAFLIRQYITIYNEKIAGAIIVGTGHQPYVLVKIGLIITRIIASFKGWRYRSKLVNHLVIGNYNNGFEPARTSADWLSKDEERVDDYVNDVKINFIFTLNAFYNMFKGILSLYNKNNLEKIPKDLSLLFLSGKEDPVGNFGKDVIKASELYINAGIKDVSCKIYEEDRHEILNEIDRKLVFQDIEQWINGKI